jgi:hypothetical protein
MYRYHLSQLVHVPLYLQIKNQSYFPVFLAVLGNMSISRFFANLGYHTNITKKVIKFASYKHSVNFLEFQIIVIYLLINKQIEHLIGV